MLPGNCSCLLFCLLLSSRYGVFQIYTLHCSFMSLAVRIDGPDSSRDSQNWSKLQNFQFSSGYQPLKDALLMRDGVVRWLPGMTCALSRKIRLFLHGRSIQKYQCYPAGENGGIGRGGILSVRNTQGAWQQTIRGTAFGIAFSNAKDTWPENLPLHSLWFGDFL